MIYTDIYSNLFSVKDKVIALIGASGILGREYVQVLARAGAELSIGDINTAACEDLARLVKDKYQAKCIPFYTDNTKPELIEEFIQMTVDHFGKLDVLINNAQVKPEGFYLPFEEYSKQTLMEVLDGNLAGMVIASQAACKQFIKQGYGNIINVASIYGIVGADQRLYEGVNNIYFPDKPFSSPVSYAVSKAGVVNFTRYLASYYRGKNIRVNCLTPGGVFDNHEDRFVSQYASRTLLGRMAEKTEYNGAILFLASEASSYMTGANLIIDGGWTAS